MNNPRVIEILEHLRKKVLVPDTPYYDAVSSGIWALKQINEMPEGRWEFYEESSDDNGMAYYKCSECGRLIHAEESGLLKNYPYCHCGATMRKGGTE